MSVLRRARPLMLSRLASAGLTFLIPLALARALTPDEYGTYKQAWLVASTLYHVLQLGLAQSLYYFVPREPERRGTYLTQAASSLALLGAAAALGLWALRPQVASYFANPALERVAPWIALTAFGMVAGAPYDIALTASGRVGHAAAVRVAVDAARTVALVVPAWWLRSFEGLMIGLGSSAVLRVAVTWWVTLRAGPPQLRWESLRRQFAYALPFGAAIAVAIPQQQFHQYAVGALATASAFAVYSVGCFQLPIVDLLYTPVSEILQVGIAHADGEGQARRAGELFREAVAHLALAFVPLVVFLFVVAPEFISLLFTERYVAAASIFRIGILSIPLSALPLEGVLRARADTRFFLWNYAAKLAVTVPLVLLLLRLLGPIGAMVGYVAAEALSKSMMLVRGARLLGVPVARALPLPDLRWYGLAAALGAGPAWALAAAAPGTPAGLLAGLSASGLVFGGIYLGVLLAAGRVAIPATVRTWLRRPAPPQSAPRPRPTAGSPADLESMCVGLVGNWPPPHGGVSVHVDGLARALRRRGVGVRVLDIGEGEHSGDGVTRGRGLVPCTAGLAALAARGYLLHTHTNGANTKSWLVALAAGRARLPGGPRAVLTLHSGLGPRWLAASSRRRRLAQAACSGYGRIVAVNEEIAGSLRACGVAGVPIDVLPAYSPALLVDGESPPELDRVRRAHAPLFCAMTAPGPTYGEDLVRPAFAAVRRELPEAGLVLFGPGSSSGPDEPGVHRLGELAHPAALAVMAACDVFVRPTRADGDALSVREAQALGRPVVASAVGHRPPGCLLFAVGDASELAARMRQAAAAPPRPAAAPGSDPFDRLLQIYAGLWRSPLRQPGPLSSGGPEAGGAPTFH